MTTWTLDLDWDGRREVFEIDPPEISEDIDIGRRRARYTPRTLTASVPLGDTWARVAKGYHHASMSVVVKYGDVEISTSPVVDMMPARRGELTTLKLADRPDRKASTIPPRYDLRIRTFDQAATRRANQGIRERNRRRLAYAYGGPAMTGSLYANAIKPAAITFETRTTVYAEKMEGRTYPIVFGRPGENNEKACRLLPVDQSASIGQVTGHVPTTGNLRVYDSSNNAETFALTVGQDAAGRAIGIVDMSAAATLSYSSEEDFYVAFNDDAGGLPGTADEVVLRLLQWCRGVRVDVHSFRAIGRHLRDYVLGRYIDEQVSAWDLLESEVLPLLPVRLVPTSRGMGLARVDLSTDPAGVAGDLYVGPDLAPAGDRPYLGQAGGIINAWSLRYGYRISNGTYKHVALADLASHGTARRSQSRYGRREDSDETAWIYNHATAQRVVADWLTLTAVERPPLQYIARPSVHGPEGDLPITPGRRYWLHDTDRSLDRVLVLCTRSRRMGGLLQYGLVPVDPWRS